MRYMMIYVCICMFVNMIKYVCVYIYIIEVIWIIDNDPTHGLILMV